MQRFRGSVYLGDGAILRKLLHNKAINTMADNVQLMAVPHFWSPSLMETNILTILKLAVEH